MTKLVLSVFPLFLAAAMHAASLAGVVELTPVAHWQEKAIPGAKIPTLQFTPPGERNAVLLVSLMPNELAKVSDDASLRAFHRLCCRPFLASPQQETPLTDLTIADGAGVYAVFEDPDLAGKPVKPGSYKFATPIAVWLRPEVVLQATFLNDEKDGADLKDALQMLQSARVTGRPRPLAPPEAPAAVQGPIIIRGPDASLTLPDRGFHPTGEARADQGYFCYANESGAAVSGWLDDARGYADFASFWAREKESLEKRAGFTLEDEKFDTVAGWSLVTYTLTRDGVTQRNLRACRVEGTTWADLHLSAVVSGGKAVDLKALLQSITFTKT